MKKSFVVTLSLSLCCLLSAPVVGGTNTTSAISSESAISASAETIRAKSAYLCDGESGKVVLEQNAEEKYPIASMCKIMTLLLSFEAVDRGAVGYGDMVTVSDNAAGMGGSQVFLEAGQSYSVGELLKTIAVCSANDSCVAMAEVVCGSEEEFVRRMNERAKELGAENTLFANCTGLPKQTQYSCAKDVSVMFRELIKHEKYFDFTKIWLEDFSHPDGRITTITNTNKLIRFYEGCDGGKTGYTSEAGFCLAATAKRGDTRLVSVVIGADSSQNRFEDSKKMMNYAFANYQTVPLLKKGERTDMFAEVLGGKQDRVELTVQKTVGQFVRKGEKPALQIEYKIGNVKAPIAKGDEIGEAIAYENGVEYARTALLAEENVERANYFDSYRYGAKNWN